MAGVAVSLPLVAGAVSNANLPTLTNGDLVYPKGSLPARTEKVTFVSESGVVLRVPFAPSDLTIEKLTPVWSTIQRPGKQELLVYTNEQLPHLTFTIFIAAEDQRNNPLGSVEEWISNFRRHVSSNQRWRFNYQSQVDKNWWRFTDMSIKTQMRSPLDNSITVATADVQLTQSSDISIRTGPVTGGMATTTPTTVASGTTTYATYTIKSPTDTLWALAVRFLGSGSRWKEIAKLNGITDPRKIRNGQILKIPSGKAVA